MLRIRNNIFEIDRTTRNTGFFISPNDAKGQFLDIALDISFCDNQYEGEQLAPSLCINYFQTKYLDSNCGDPPLDFQHFLLHQTTLYVPESSRKH